MGGGEGEGGKEARREGKENRLDPFLLGKMNPKKLIKGERTKDVENLSRGFPLPPPPPPSNPPFNSHIEIDSNFEFSIGMMEEFNQI